MTEQPKIEVSAIPDWSFDVGCRVLDKCIRRLFERPEIRREYEEWKQKKYGNKEAQT